jgi:hypothetical protein
MVNSETQFAGECCNEWRSLHSVSAMRHTVEHISVTIENKLN